MFFISRLKQSDRSQQLQVCRQPVLCSWRGNTERSITIRRRVRGTTMCHTTKRTAQIVCRNVGNLWQ